MHSRDFLKLEDRNAGIHQFLQRLGNVLESHRLVADVEDDAEMAAQRAVRLGDRNIRQLGELLGRGARVEVLGEIIDGFVGGLEEAMRLRLERKLHRSSGPRLHRDQMRDDAQHVLGVARDHVVAGDARLEAERRGLDR